MNKKKWEQVSGEITPLLKQLSDIAIKHETSILSITINTNGYIDAFMIEDNVHYIIHRHNRTEDLELCIRDCNKRDEAEK